MHLVLCPDENYAEHAAVVLASVFANISDPGRLKIWMVANELSARSRALLVRVVGQGGGQIEFLTIDTARLGAAPVGGHVSLAGYYRLLVPANLPSVVERFLYLDSDLIVEDDIAPLFAVDLGDNVLAAVANPCSRHAQLGLRADAPYFNSGVLVIDRRRWLAGNVSERALAVIAEKPDVLRYWDQDALNCVIAGCWTPLEPAWNQQHYFIRIEPGVLDYEPEAWRRALEHPRIIHFSGVKKPWHAKTRHPFRARYHHYRRRAGLPPLWLRPAHLIEALRSMCRLAKSTND